MDKTVQGAKLQCKDKPNDFIILNCEESDILLSYLSVTENLDDLKKSQKIELNNFYLLNNTIKKILNNINNNKYKLSLIIKLLNYFINIQPTFFDKNELTLLNMLYYGSYLINIFGIIDTGKTIYDEYDSENNMIFMVLPIIFKITSLIAHTYEKKDILSSAEDLEQKKLYIKNYKKSLTQNTHMKSLLKLENLLKKIIEKIQTKKQWSTIKGKELDLKEICINNLDNCNQQQCEFSDEMKKFIRKVDEEKYVKKLKVIELDILLQNELKSMDVFYKDISNKIYNFLQKYFNFDNYDNLQKFINIDIYAYYNLIKSDIYNRNILKLQEIKIVINEKIQNFMKIISDNEINIFYHSINELYYMLFLVIFYLEKENIKYSDKNDLELKIKNIIYVNIIKSGILTFENKSKKGKRRVCRKTCKERTRDINGER
jgi:hypothetical protein